MDLYSKSYRFLANLNRLSTRKPRLNGSGQLSLPFRRKDIAGLVKAVNQLRYDFSIAIQDAAPVASGHAGRRSNVRAAGGPSAGALHSQGVESGREASHGG